MHPVTKIAAHRGGWGRPENSMAAMENAIAIGADMVEFDVRSTADHHLLLCHDRTVSGRGISDATLAELHDLCGDATPPLLEDVVVLCSARILMDVELKETGSEAATVAILRKHCGIDEFVVTSFMDEVIAEVKRIDPAVRCGLLLGGNHINDVSPWRRMALCRADFIAPHLRLGRSGLWRRARRRGVPVAMWTVNGERAIRRSLRQGVEVLITDTPALALRIRDQLPASRGWRRARSDRAA